MPLAAMRVWGGDDYRKNRTEPRRVSSRRSRVPVADAIRRAFLQSASLARPEAQGQAMARPPPRAAPEERGAKGKGKGSFEMFHLSVLPEWSEGLQ